MPVTGSERSTKDRLLHSGFLASVLFKLGLGLAQLAAAAGLAVTSKNKMIALVAELTAAETQQDPTDPLASWLMHSVSAFSVEAHTFYVLYFAGHGVLNAVIALALLKRWLWSYPVSIIVLGAFVIYQFVRFYLTLSPVMIFLSLFDILIIILVWREWMQIRRQAPGASVEGPVG